MTNYGITKKQHFVARFYLKNFGEQVFCYDKLHYRVFRSTYKDLGHENYFYEIDDVAQGTSEKTSFEDWTFLQNSTSMIGARDVF